jgi:hypothetical protein
MYTERMREREREKERWTAEVFIWRIKFKNFI